MRPIAISLSPNTTKADIKNAWNVLLHSSLWRDESILADAAAKLAGFFPDHSVVLTSSGRQALYDALRATGIGEGDEVIIQAFTCIAVPAPIVWTGAKPVYADITPHGYNVDAEDVRGKITARTKAIVVQHTFGIPGPLEELRNIAKEHNLLLIEDCAHAFGGEYMNKPLGTYGDIAILSFGRDKMISSVFGGAIVTKRQAVVQAAQKMQQERKYPPAFWVIQQLLHPILFQYIISNYYRAHIGKVLLVAAQKLGLLSKAVAPEERQGKQPRHTAYRFSPALGHLLLQQLEHFPQTLKRRQEIAARYMSVLHNTSAHLPAIPLGSSPSWLRFPIAIDHPADLHKKAQAQHMLLGDWYDAPLVPAAASFEAFRYSLRMCPRAEEAAHHAVNLPTYPSLTEDQVERVLRFIRQYHE